MAQDTKIEWAHHTFNPWRGCTKVSDGCANCYAETMSKRNPLTLGVWGPNGTRVVAAEAAWREPLKWDRLAAEACERHRVFCASLADVFEDWRGPMVDHKGNVIRLNRLTGKWGKWPGPSDEHQPLTMQDVRLRLFDLIDRTPNLDWLLLTKRPENIATMMPPSVTNMRILVETKQHEQYRPNVWIGTSVEDQATADERIPHLLRVPAKVRFLSVEPLLGSIKLDLLRLEAGNPSRCICGHGHGFTRCPNTGGISQACEKSGCQQFIRKPGSWNGIDWVIIGGESGHHARPCNVEWIRGIVRQCKAAGVPVLVKQVGSRPTGGLAGEWVAVGARMHGGGGVTLWDKKGGDPLEWPDDLRVREVPRPA